MKNDIKYVDIFRHEECSQKSHIKKILCILENTKKKNF